MPKLFNFFAIYKLESPSRMSSAADELEQYLLMRPVEFADLARAHVSLSALSFGGSATNIYIPALQGLHEIS